MVESEFCAARAFLQSQMAEEASEETIVKTLEAMPTVLTTLQLALVFGASTAT